ncbi:MAG TPA: thiamine pyrophosphate-dependent enzyme [Solirubrobacteraceae bacterium]|jgi:thiamine pyrophosphate-dependent acetolactate synthase large subunit-like protein|nr:thiamine pyrophosphate-dependent enzyme [Solirubrobacteraceae bacterium]
MTDRINPYRLAAATVLAAGLRRSTTALFAESSSAMFFSTNALAALTGERHPYARASMHYGSMGHAIAGAIGFCAATRQRAIVFTGDGSLHLMNPLPTALKHRLQLAIVVLNDARLSLPFRGSGSIGAKGAQSTTSLPAWDFTQVGNADVGRRRITRNAEVEAGLDEALAFNGCFVLDALTDPAVAPPIRSRLQSVNTMLGGGSGRRSATAPA